MGNLRARSKSRWSRIATIVLLLGGWSIGLIVWRIRADAHQHELNYALAHAIQRGTQADLSEIKSLVKDGANPNVREYYFIRRESALDLVKRVVKRRQPPPIGIGKTAISLSAEYADLDLARLLIDRGADVNLTAKSGNAALLEFAENRPHLVARLTGASHRAMLDDCREFIRVLLKAGADPNGQDGKGNTPYKAAMQFQDDGIDQIFQKYGGRWDFKGQTGNTGLFRATECGRTNLVRQMLAEGANPNERSKSNSDSVLTVAIQNRHSDIAILLLNAGANVNATGKSNPLISAIDEKGSVALVKLLLERGANPAVTDGFLKDAWYWAERLHNQPVLRLLEAHAKKQSANHGKP